MIILFIISTESGIKQFCFVVWIGGTDSVSFDNYIATVKALRPKFWPQPWPRGTLASVSSSWPWPRPWPRGTLASVSSSWPRPRPWPRGTLASVSSSWPRPRPALRHSGLSLELLASASALASRHSGLGLEIHCYVITELRVVKLLWSQGMVSLKHETTNGTAHLGQVKGSVGQLNSD